MNLVDRDFRRVIFNTKASRDGITNELWVHIPITPEMWTAFYHDLPSMPADHQMVLWAKFVRKIPQSHPGAPAWELEYWCACRIEETGRLMRLTDPVFEPFGIALSVSECEPVELVNPDTSTSAEIDTT